MGHYGVGNESLNHFFEALLLRVFFVEKLKIYKKILGQEFGFWFWWKLQNPLWKKNLFIKFLV